MLASLIDSKFTLAVGPPDSTELGTLVDRKCIGGTSEQCETLCQQITGHGMDGEYCRGIPSGSQWTYNDESGTINANQSANRRLATSTTSSD